MAIDNTSSSSPRSSSDHCSGSSEFRIISLAPMERLVSEPHSLANLPSEIIHYICQHLQSHDLFHSVFVLCRHWYESLSMYPTIFLRRCKNTKGAIQVLRNRFKDLRFLNLSGLQLYEGMTSVNQEEEEMMVEGGMKNKILQLLRESMRDGCTKLNYFRMANCLTSPKDRSSSSFPRDGDMMVSGGSTGGIGGGSGSGVEDLELGGDGNNWYAEPSKDGEEVIIEISPKFIETIVFEMMGQIKRIRVEDIPDADDDVNCNAKSKGVSLFISRCKNVTTETFETLALNPRFCSSVTKMMLEWDIGIDSEAITILSKYFTNITSLSVANCVNIDSVGFVEISKMHTIHTLTLVGTTIKDQDLIVLSNLPNLKSIDLTGCKNTIENEESIVQFLEKCGPQMEELFLVDCNLTDWTLFTIKNKLKNLKFIDLSWNVEITDEGMFNILGELPNLESFNITTGAKIELAILLKDDNSLSTISTREYDDNDIGKDSHFLPLLPNLTKLNMNVRNYQCNESIQSILRNAPNLMSLQLSGCSRITSDAFSNLDPKIYRLKSLKEIHLMRCSWMTDDALDKLLPLCVSSLESLFLQRSKFSKEKIDEWKYKLEKIKKIGYPKRT